MAFSSHSSGSDDDLNAMHDINVTPFIDVMLVLLIIFMVAAPLSTSSIPIDLPSTTAKSTTPPPKPLTVSVKQDDSLFINDTNVAPAQLGGQLDQITKGDKSTRIFLRADKDVAYEKLISVMDLLRDDGYTQVALVGLEATGGANKS
ncbi:TonB system transport protein ExbD [Klebsiella indica]|uniref:Biopolymer transport protein ExbD n=1 Tax=Klebsiella indica TaxID=2582917 RepID=A0A5R9L9C9_9ENTR|nr:TonB system transport protein ExbD [Klebsiella indica]TLV05000.1 TonB system transport protein ExbD [Klebsiella indica]